MAIKDNHPPSQVLPEIDDAATAHAPRLGAAMACVTGVAIRDEGESGPQPPSNDAAVQTVGLPDSLGD